MEIFQRLKYKDEYSTMLYNFALQTKFIQWIWTDKFRINLNIIHYSNLR